MKYKVILEGFASKGMAEAFVDWYLNQGQDEFNNPDTWQKNEDDNVWSFEEQDLQWDKDSLTVKLNAFEGEQK